MGAENVFLEPHAKRRRGEPASVADEMLDEEDDDGGLERGLTVVGVAEDDLLNIRPVKCCSRRKGFL